MRLHTGRDRRSIVVVGSINMDLVWRAKRLPIPGETVLDAAFATFHGGKGANQAVAAARLGAEVHLVGRVGDDDLAGRLLAGLEENGVRTGAVKITRGAASGVAAILVGERGENSIVVAPGANSLLSPADVDAAERFIRRSAVLVAQLEVPVATVRRAMVLARRHGVFTILDPAPAPARGLPPALRSADVLSPNELEAAALLGRRLPRGAAAIAGALLRLGPRTVVLKLGARGALHASRGGATRSVRAFRVEAIDTTAAGDAFTGALAVGMSEGWPLDRAVRFACAAGAVAATKRGAQPSLPSRRAVERLLARGR
jgi:ribokinase